MFACTSCSYLVSLCCICHCIFRPLAAASVIPLVTALLNHLLKEIESEKLGKGLCFSFLSLSVLK